MASLKIKGAFMIYVLLISRGLTPGWTTWMHDSWLKMKRLKLSRTKSLIFSVLMMKNEGKTTDWCIETIDCFWCLYLVFKSFLYVVVALILMESKQYLVLFLLFVYLWRQIGGDIYAVFKFLFLVVKTVWMSNIF